MNGMGTLYGVGVGPGDPDLITLKAVRVLRRVPIILIPQSTDRPSVALSIVQRWLRPVRQQIVMQPYPMRGAASELEQARLDGVFRVCSFLQTGSTVACVTEGDPLLYSTFIDLLERVSDTLPDLSVEIIPAVSSITACAAAARLPLARGRERIAVVPAEDAVEELETLLQRFETIVLIKVRRVYERLRERLQSLQLERHAVLIQQWGRPDERILPACEMRSAEDLSYFSTVLLSKHRTPEVARCGVR
jgi:precorrin-2/cobalt-factor-2 C20-methyltransferase